MEIQEVVAKAFQSELGQQLDTLFSTSDNRVFVRKEEAIAHANGKLDKNTLPLKDKSVYQWFDEIDLLSTKVYDEK